jgi:hypothetical protein
VPSRPGFADEINMCRLQYAAIYSLNFTKFRDTG